MVTVVEDVAVPSDIVETKTARRKRIKAEKKNKLDAHLAAIALADQERRRKSLRERLCSEYWVSEASAPTPRPVYPQTRCQCRRCNDLRKFPPIHYGSRGISYDCFVEAVESRRQAAEPRHAMTEDEARADGLTIRYPKAPNGPPVVLVPGCEMCEAGLKPKGDRYCLICADLVKRAIRKRAAGV